MRVSYWVWPSVVALLSACSSTIKVAQENLGFEIAEQSQSVSRNWARTLPGLVTDVGLTSDGARALVTLVPDTEGIIKGTAPKVEEPALAMLNEEGEVIWRKSLGAKPKWQVMSKIGSLIAATTTEGKLYALDNTGKVLWERDNYCRPLILEKSGRVLCHRWDDAKPTGIGFEVYDLAGNKVHSFAVPGELLDLSLAPDEKTVALALTGGKVVVVDLETFKAVWEVKAPGQLIGISLASTPDPLLSVFHYRKADGGKHQPTLSIFGAGGKLQQQLTPAGQFDQVVSSPTGQWIALYGNSAHGQLLVALGRPASGEPFQELWRHRSNHYSDFNSSLVVTDDRIIVGFDDGASSGPGKSVTHLFAFNRAGKVEWAVPLISEDGGYLFAYSGSAKVPKLLGISDNGEINSFRIED